MPTEPKTPNCVEMKQRIQADLELHYAGMNSEERRRQRLKDITSNPVLGPLYTRLAARQGVQGE